MAYIGKTPTAAPLTSSDVTDGIISTAKIADTAITNAKLNADIISGDTALGAEPADTDELLVSDAGVLKRMDYSHIKASGGLSESDQWRITSNFSLGTSSAFITANLERVDTVFDKVGTGMSESSGVFSFPSTGIWLVMMNVEGNGGGTQYVLGEIFVTEDDSAYTRRGSGTQFSSASNRHWGLSCMVQVDVTDITNVKIKFGGYKQDTNAMNFNGSTDENSTCFTFIKLGDT
jgi:hypothetical protein